MTKAIIKFSKISAVVLLLSFSSNSFASHGYGYVPLALAVGYLAHHKYSHNVHHRSYGKRYYGHGNRYYNKHAYSYGHRNRHYGKRYYNYGHRNRYYGKRYNRYGNRRYH